MNFQNKREFDEFLLAVTDLALNEVNTKEFNGETVAKWQTAFMGLMAPKKVTSIADEKTITIGAEEAKDDLESISISTEYSSTTDLTSVVAKRPKKKVNKQVAEVQPLALFNVNVEKKVTKKTVKAPKKVWIPKSEKECKFGNRCNRYYYDKNCEYKH